MCVLLFLPGRARRRTLLRRIWPSLVTRSTSTTCTQAPSSAKQNVGPHRQASIYGNVSHDRESASCCGRPDEGCTFELLESGTLAEYEFVYFFNFPAGKELVRDVKDSTLTLLGNGYRCP
mmetsp:Transcript_9663/g.35415  ORF Transcript_9663/g.35415 Transcript_9663/m.35415 type:complete len:120 (+) Transcript_9663:75-434(+)